MPASQILQVKAGCFQIAQSITAVKNHIYIQNTGVPANALYIEPAADGLSVNVYIYGVLKYANVDIINTLVDYANHAVTDVTDMFTFLDWLRTKIYNE